MALFSKFKEPVIFKEDSNAKAQLEELEKLLVLETDEKIKKAIENDIAAIKAGIYGEDALMYELKNSHIPMYVLHDLYFEHAGLTAQIDYLLVTIKRVFIVECKNLYGDIAIDNTGSFVRNFGYKKEGIYSPITQCKRHLDLLKAMVLDAQSNALVRALVDRNFSDNYRDIVVLANPKTVLNAKYAPKDVKSRVIRADQLISYINKINAEPGGVTANEKDIESWAKFFLKRHTECKTDYFAKYRTNTTAEQDSPKPAFQTVAVTSEESVTPAANSVSVPAKPYISETPLCPKCGAPMVKRTASKGGNVGSSFWGCSQFPKCRGIVNISG